MEYIFGEYYEQEVEQGVGDLPDIGYPIPDEKQNNFLLSNLKLKE